MNEAGQRRWEPETLLLLRMERNVVHLATLGPRPLLEFLLEVGRHNNCMADVANRLESYAELTPAMVRAAGADRLARRRLVLVPA